MWAIKTRYGYVARGLVHPYRTTQNRSEATRFGSIERAQEVLRLYFPNQGGMVVPAEEDRK